MPCHGQLSALQGVREQIGQRSRTLRAPCPVSSRTLWCMCSLSECFREPFCANFVNSNIPDISVTCFAIIPSKATYEIGHFEFAFQLLLFSIVVSKSRMFGRNVYNWYCWVWSYDNRMLKTMLCGISSQKSICSFGLKDSPREAETTLDSEVNEDVFANVRSTCTDRYESILNPIKTSCLSF